MLDATEGPEDHRAGGAANVARGIAALGGRAVLAAARGDDGDGRRLAELLAKDGIEDRCVVTPDRMTTTKTRVLAGQQQIVRIDRERTGPLPAAFEKRLRDEALAAAEDCRALVVSDYDKGVLSEKLLDAVGASFRARRLPIVVDPNVSHFFHYGPETVLTPNQFELERAMGRRVRDDAGIHAVAREALDRLPKGTRLLVTRGEAGMSIYMDTGEPVHIPTKARQVFDVTGAGDTVVATLALALAVGADLVTSARVANFAAGIVVGKRGASTVAPEELSARLSEEPS